MRSEKIVYLLNSLGCEKIRHTSKGDIVSSCPFASWSHRGGRDKRPSFHVYADGVSGCFCHSCGFKGRLSKLIYDYQKKSGRKLPNLVNLIHQNDDLSVEERIERADRSNSFYASKPQSSVPVPASSVWVGDGKDYSDPLIAALSVSALPESHVDYVSMMVDGLDEGSLAYLHGPSRRFTDETIRKWKLGFHAFAGRVSVPQYDHAGRLVNISGRIVPYWPDCVPLADTEDRRAKWMHSYGFHRELYLFGENFLELTGVGSGVVFVVEGAFDVIYLSQEGLPNVVGINGSYINKIQVDKIVRWFEHVVLVMDGDDPGIDAANLLEKILAPKIGVSKYRIPDGRDPNQMTIEEIDYLKNRFLNTTDS